MVDGRAVNGNLWVFYGGLTDVEYTVSVKQESSSLLRTYRKEAGGACGGFDTEAFRPLRRSRRPRRLRRRLRAKANCS